MSIPRTALTLGLAGLAMLAPTPAAFGEPPAPPAPDASPTATPEEQRIEANNAQLKFAQDQLAQNAANQKAYDDAIKANEETVAAQKAAADKAQADYEAAMKKWQEDVEACKAGDATRCAPPAQ